MVFSWQRFSIPYETHYLGLGQSLYLCWSASALGLSEQTADPANQGLDESVARADLAVQTLHLQQLPLQSFSETCCHVALQLVKVLLADSGQTKATTSTCL